MTSRQASDEAEAEAERADAEEVAASLKDPIAKGLIQRGVQDG